ncbi:MAG TPA: glycosyltransferase family 39 protein [Lysobacter sp.]
MSAAPAWLPPALRRPWLWIALLAVVLALGFLGSRGIWDPDEGRYTNVALNMLDSGDWLNPRRNDEVGHWTKPPLTYWAIASSIAVFGQTPFAARLPAAVSYLLCVLFVALIARRLAPGSARTAAVAYATMLFPFGATQFITTDYVLAATETLAVWAFVEARFGATRRSLRWLVLMWAGFGLAFLTKGPPGLLPLLPILAYDWLLRGHARHRVLQWSGVLVFVAIALPWYAAVIHGNPGLLRYFLGEEVVGRIASNEFRRHGEWWGWLEIYVPTLLVGTLPWTGTLWRWLRALPAQLRDWRVPAVRGEQRGWLLATLWLALPLLVFCLSRSRLPLYILPLFGALALLVAMQRQREGRALPPWPRLVAWAALLLALKAAAAYWPTHKNAADWAREIRARTQDHVGEVLFVDDMARYGLHLHLGRGVEIERITLDPYPQSRFNPDYDEDLATELGEHEPDTLWITHLRLWPKVRARIEAQGFDVAPLGAPYEERVLFRVTPRPADAVPPAR